MRFEEEGKGGGMQPQPELSAEKGENKHFKVTISSFTNLTEKWRA